MMGKARLIGKNNAYIPNSKADRRFCKNMDCRGAGRASRFADPVQDRRDKHAKREAFK